MSLKHFYLFIWKKRTGVNKIHKKTASCTYTSGVSWTYKSLWRSQRSSPRNIMGHQNPPCVDCKWILRLFIDAERTQQRCFGEFYFVSVNVSVETAAITPAKATRLVTFAGIIAAVSGWTKRILFFNKKRLCVSAPFHWITVCLWQKQPL